MPTKSLTVVRPGQYGTRMLKAGDAYDATGPEARLFVKLGWMSDVAPKVVRPPSPTKAPAKPKAPRKRKAPAKKKSA